MIGSTVCVYIANGERAGTAQIPAILGTDVGEAKSQLEELGLTVETVYDDESKAAKDTVISSSPLPYGKVEKGTVVTLTVSSGKGDKRTVEVIVELPSYVTGSLEMTVLVDGEIDSSLTKTVYPSSGSSVNISFEGTGRKSVVVQLDGQTYREYTIDFTAGAVTNTVVHEFVVQTDPPTEAPTEPETIIYYTEPVPYETVPETNAVDNGF